MSSAGIGLLEVGSWCRLHRKQSGGAFCWDTLAMRVAVGSHPEMMRVNLDRFLADNCFQVDLMLGRCMLSELMGNVSGSLA